MPHLVHSVCRILFYFNYLLRNRMIKRESGENPELSCSCKSHIRANMTSLRFLGRRLPSGDKSEDLPFALSFKAPSGWAKIENVKKETHIQQTLAAGICVVRICQVYDGAACRRFGKAEPP